MSRFPEECFAVTGRAPIRVRWVDVNKGDDVTPNYKSRLVAQEVNRDRRDAIFAAMPPLEAKKALFSIAATKRAKSGQSYKV